MQAAADSARSSLTAFSRRVDENSRLLKVPSLHPLAHGCGRRNARRELRDVPEHRASPMHLAFDALGKRLVEHCLP